MNHVTGEIPPKQTLTFDVGGMACDGCTSSVQRVVSQLDGIGNTVVSLHPGLVTLVANPMLVTPIQIEAAIQRLGYSAKLRQPLHEAQS